MKLSTAYLLVFLNLVFFCNVKAEVINNFKIEGIKIGDNLLDHAENIGLSLESLKNFKLVYYPNSKKFAGLNIVNKGNYKTFDTVQFHINPNNYKIHSVSGKMYKSSCFKELDIMFEEIKNLYPSAEIYLGKEKKHKADKTGNSMSKFHVLKFINGQIRFDCQDWSDEFRDSNGNKPKDGIMVSVLSNEFFDWLKNDAYKK